MALELMRRRVVRDTERRLAGDVLAEVVDGRARRGRAARPAAPVRRRATRPRCWCSRSTSPQAAEAALGAALVEAGGAGAGRDARRAAVRGRRRLGEETRSRSRRSARAALAEEHGAGARRGQPGRPTSRTLRRSFHEARYALEATAMLDGRAPEVASWRDLGALQFLLSVQDDEALRLYCDSVLGPIESGEGEYGGELLRSLEAFVEHNGQWERAARELFCHRHTLRYRIRRVEQLTGRDLVERARPDRVLAGAEGAGSWWR